jgi:Fur family transcriptional regulator, peroxide stress response regulator
MRSPDELVTLFRSRGLKMTPQRQAVFNALHHNDRHPTADIIWSKVCEQLPAVSQKTVYQALNDLVELGEIRAVNVDNGAARFDPNVSDHAHFVCDQCQRVYDVTASTPQLVGQHHADIEHIVTSAEVIFRGRCAQCDCQSPTP